MSTRLRLSPHFVIEEFDCHDGTHTPEPAIVSLRFLVVQVLEPMRSAFGAVSIESGYRTPHENGLVGGALESRHLYDVTPHTPAVDFTCATGTTRDWYEWLRARVTQGGLGYYRDHVHVDLRATKARW